MAKPAPRELTVLGARNVTPNMRRITFGGEGMAGFPADQACAYVKLMLPTGEGARPFVRTYTVRAHRKDEIDVDFALHEDCGPATLWALTAKVGDTLLVGGPGPRKLVQPDSEFVLMVGDMTALPAISGNIEMLPANAKGVAFIEIMDAGDAQDFDVPEGFDVRWVINAHPGEDGHLLVDQVKGLAWPEGKLSVWVACEFSTMRQLRDYFRVERGLDAQSLYISSYWKAGINEDKHKLVKRADAEAMA